MDETVPRVIRAQAKSGFSNKARRRRQQVERDREYAARLHVAIDVPAPTTSPALPKAGPVTIVRADGVEVRPAYKGGELAHVLGEREPLPEAVRRAILKRDGYRCRYCRKRRKVMHVDHVIPVILGGTNEWANLVTACRRCNLKKGMEVWTPLALC